MHLIEGAEEESCPLGCGHTWHGEPCNLRIQTGVGVRLDVQRHPWCECPGVFGVLEGTKIERAG